MANSRASSSGKLTTVEDYEATGAEGTKTFTFTADTMDDTSVYLLYIDLVSTAAFNLLMQINGDTTAKYNLEGGEYLSGTETQVNQANANEFTLITTSGINGADQSLHAKIEILLTKGAASKDKPGIIATLEGGATESSQVSGVLAENHDNLSSIKIYTSTSTWKIGARMTLYKLAR